MKLSLAIFYLWIASASAAKDVIVMTNDGALQLSVRRYTFVPNKMGTGSTPAPEGEELRFSVSFDVTLKNISKEVITVPTGNKEQRARIRSQGRGYAKIDYLFLLLPDDDGVIYVNPPSVFGFVTLRPGEATYLSSFGVGTNDESSLPQYIFVYHVDPVFAERYECWNGKLTVVSEMQKPDKPSAATTPKDRSPP